MNKKKWLRVFSVLLSGFMVFNLFVLSTPVKAQEVGTYAYEDVPLYGTAEFVMGDVDITVYTRYSSTTQKYTFLRYTYEDSFSWNYPLASVTSVICNNNYDSGDEITDNIMFTVKATNGIGTTWTETVTIGVN